MQAVGCAAVAALVLVACAATDPGVVATRSGSGSGALVPDDIGGEATGGTTPITSPANFAILPGVVDFGDVGPQHPGYDGFLTAAFGDIESFWKDEFPTTYDLAFTPLSGGIYAASPSRTSPIPGCGTPESTYEDIQRGTAFYCLQGDFIAYDDAEGLPNLVQQLGRAAVAVVLAHEFGHVIQARAGEWNQPGILKEQQADCFAGAWAAHVASGLSSSLRFTDADVRAGLVAMINVADPTDGTGLGDPLAHGTGFDRVGAFQDGFQGGSARCKTFFSEDRLSKLIDITFDAEDVNNGNLPLVDADPDPKNGPQDIITLIPGSLDFFWTDLALQNNVPFTKPTFTAFAGGGPFPTCQGTDPAAWPGSVRYCPADNTIYWDQDYASGLAQDPINGDMSVGYLFADAYSDAIQTALHSGSTGEKRALANDCLTGAWVAFIVPPIPAERADALKLSAGDLDEAVATAISRGDPTTDTNVNGSAFEKISAFRTGVLGGLDECRGMIG